MLDEQKITIASELVRAIQALRIARETLLDAGLDSMARSLDGPIGTCYGTKNKLLRET